MKFVVDCMLGSLARWLRMLGFETEYDSKADDNDLLQRTLHTNAILLTRDEELHKRALAKGVEAFLVVGDSDEVRLGRLSKSLGFPVDLSMSKARCPECGSSLREISKSEAAETVPQISLKTYDKFWQCKNSECAKVYWLGSHMHNIRQTLEEAQTIASGKV